MRSYRQWKVLNEAGENAEVDTRINKLVDETMAEIEQYINDYLSRVAPQASSSTSTSTPNRLGQWVGDTGTKIKDTVRSGLGLNEPSTNAKLRREIDAKRREAIAGGASPEEAETQNPYPTKGDALNRVLKGSGKPTKGVSGWLSDRLGHLFMKKEMLKIDDTLQDICETRQLQNLFYSLGVSKYLLTESNDDVAKVRGQMRGVLQKLGSQVAGLTRGIDPARDANEPPSPTGVTPAQASTTSPPTEEPAVPAASTEAPLKDLSKENVLQIAHDHNYDIRLTLKALGLIPENAPDNVPLDSNIVTHLVTTLINQANAKIDEKGLAIPKLYVQNGVVQIPRSVKATITRRGRLPNPFITVLSAIESPSGERGSRVKKEPEPDPEPIGPDTPPAAPAAPALASPPPPEKPTTPPEEEEDEDLPDYEDSKDNVKKTKEVAPEKDHDGFEEPSWSQLSHIDRIPSDGFKGWRDLEDLIIRQNIHPADILARNPHLKRQLIYMLNAARDRKLRDIAKKL
jgi:hypothetical protein